MSQDTNYLSSYKESYCAQELEGFMVEGMMKRAWAVQLDILKMFDDICKRRGLTWFVDYGTLLGAVRHKGFIPWDDDVDVCMLRPDYDRLIACIEEELPEGYFFRYPAKNETEKIKKYKETFGRITNGMTLNYDKDHLEKFHGCPFVMGIDIFPVSGLPEDKEERDLLLAVADILQVTFDKFKHISMEKISEEEKQKKREKLYDEVARVEELCGVRIDRSGDVYQQLLSLADDLSRTYSMGECSEVAELYLMHMVKQPILKKEWFEGTVLLPFEQLMLPCPKGYKEVLTAEYGDYMVPVIGVASHDYPVYKEGFYSTFKDIEPCLRKREEDFARKMHVQHYEIKELNHIAHTIIADYYCYFYDGKYYVSRIPHEQFPFLDWEREKSVYQALEDTGLVISPVFMQEEDGFKISCFQDVFFRLDKNNMEQVADGMALLNAFHHVGYSGKKGVSPLDMLCFFEINFKEMLSGFRDIMSFYLQMQDVIKKWKQFPAHIGVTHMNLSSRSFLQYSEDEEKEILLLDLKYAGMGDMDWDIAILSANLLYEEQEILNLLTLYYGDSISEREYTEIYQKTLLGACIASWVKGIWYRVLADSLPAFRKEAYRSLKYTRKLLNIL